MNVISFYSLLTPNTSGYEEKKIRPFICYECCMPGFPFFKLQQVANSKTGKKYCLHLVVVVTANLCGVPKPITEIGQSIRYQTTTWSIQ
jgi:hypothetical protein